MPLAIRCSNLVKTYPGRPAIEAVRGIDLDVMPGECLGILGPNGAGKTTTVEILEGLVKPSGGDVEVFGMSWETHAAEIRQRIGVSLQETQLSARQTVMETVTLFRSFFHQGISPAEAISRVSLQEKANTRINKLSGGQKQRLAIATAIVGEPELLFLDEPTAALDPQSRRQVWDLVSDCKQQGRTVLLTTHNMDEADRLCDRVAIIDRGLIIASGSPRDLISGLGVEHVVEFSLEQDPHRCPTAEQWRDLEDVLDSKQHNGCFQLSVRRPQIVIPALMNRLLNDDWRLAGLTTRYASLDDVFAKVAGRSIQEAEGVLDEAG